MVGVDPEHIALAGPAQRLFDVADAIDAAAATQENGTCAAIARPIIWTASAGLVANGVPAGTCAAVIRAGSPVQAFGRYKARSMKAWP